MLRFYRSNNKPVCAIPQNAITPHRIYTEAMKGHDVAQYAYAPNPDECPREDDYSVPIDQKRGSDINDLYQAQVELDSKKAKFEAEKKQLLKDKRQRAADRERFIKSLEK